MFAACQQAGADVTLAQCQALVTESDVSDAEAEGPFAAMSRLGLPFGTSTPTSHAPSVRIPTANQPTDAGA
jgi:hypothetical protein